MLYRRSVNKLMRRADPPLLPLVTRPLRNRRSPSFGLMSRPVYALKSLILIHPPPWISTIRDLATNRRLFLLDRPRLMIRYAEERVADFSGRAGTREGRGGGVGNRIACLPRIFPPSCGNSFHGSERRAAKTELCDYIPL